jgi:hypothetical protein
MSGLVSYTEKFGAGWQGPGIPGQAARFEALIKGDLFHELCLLPEPLRSEIPECAGEGGGGHGPPAPPDLPLPPLPDPDDLPDLPDIPDLPTAPAGSADDLLSPRQPADDGIGTILRGLTSGGGVGG